MKWLALIVCLAANPALAQQQADPQPQVEVELDQTRIIPGQAATLRVTVLVPSWMPKPVEFPAFEAPNLRVRLPERATTSISRQIDGATWAGVSRRYLLSPMVPGNISLPAQDMVITYTDATGQPISVTVQTGQIDIAGIIPEGAEGLDPFIAASDLELVQDLSGPTADLAPGSSVIRTLTAKISGASPIILPRLGPPIDITGVKAYEDQPDITEQDDRGALSGQRIERSTLMAVGGGSGAVPEIRLDWFDLDTSRIETAVVAGFDISVTGPPAKSDAPRDWRRIAMVGAALVALALALGYLLPRLARWARSRRANWLASPGYARKALLHQIAMRDYPGTMAALSAWQAKVQDIAPACRDRIDACLLQISAPIYGQATPAQGNAQAWQQLAKAVQTASAPDKAASSDLPRLNGLGDHPSLR